MLADYDQVHDAITNARLTDGTRLTEAETLAVACDAKILPGIFNKHTGNPLLGRSRRKVSARHRKRLVARDGGCIGCGASHTICEVHHDHHWAHGGDTTLDNTCLVCWRCHHIRIHLQGEVITRHPNGRRTLAPPNAAGGDKPPGGNKATPGGSGGSGGSGSSGGSGNSGNSGGERASRPPPQNHHQPHHRPATDQTRPDPPLPTARRAVPATAPPDADPQPLLKGPHPHSPPRRVTRTIRTARRRRCSPPRET